MITTDHTAILAKIANTNGIALLSEGTKCSVGNAMWITLPKK